MRYSKKEKLRKVMKDVGNEGDKVAEREVTGVRKRGLE